MTDYNVTNQTELNSALGSAGTGDRVILNKSGNPYDGWSLTSKICSAADPLIITSLDTTATNRAVIEGNNTGIKFDGCQGIVVDNIDYQNGNEDFLTSNNNLSSDITIQYCNITGSVSSAANGMVSGGIRVKILHNYFYGYNISLYTNHIGNVDVEWGFNELEKMWTDFTRIGQNGGSYWIHDNYFHNPHASGASHRDFIQHNQGSTNVPSGVIERNIFNDDVGVSGVQGIFANSFANMVIQDNLFIGRHTHMIYISVGSGNETENVTVQWNTSLAAQGTIDSVPVINNGNAAAIIYCTKNVSDDGSNDGTGSDNHWLTTGVEPDYTGIYDSDYVPVPGGGVADSGGVRLYGTRYLDLRAATIASMLNEEFLTPAAAAPTAVTLGGSRLTLGGARLVL